ncbi:hypothetical protein BDM02DRAFT_510746 [Thelephora ganbajun]|uniref:Uncharacterized protein n=1 Tax=Thelephora ganbajun TaxID=370292 RepID=A0ACB6Z6X2_THEGA|nr:hypothetical protein BDM02DRAFT_510746 [Thelephora ganbajun]
MSFFLPLAILFLPAVAAPVPAWAPRSSLGVATGTSALGFGAYPGPWTPRELMTVPKTSLVSTTSITDSLSLMGTGLDTGLSSTLQDLTVIDSALDLHLGTWISSDDLGNYLGTDTLSLAIPATGLAVRVGEEPESWVSILETETSSQAIADLESSSWILLDDLACDLTADTFVSVQSILVYQPDGSSDATVYVSLTDLESTLNALPLDHTLDSFLYTDIVGVSPDPGPGNDLGTATPLSESPSSDPYLDASTQVGSETDLLVSNDDLEINSNIVADGTSDLLTSTSSLDFDTNLTDSLDTSIKAGLTSSLSDLGVSACS